jgi:Protein of Unknown function (DUF2784)
MAYGWYLFAADLILALHFAFVAFVGLGLAVIWVGYFAGWGWVRGKAFRIAHLAAMGFVLAESLVGVICPLTEWESALRRQGGAEGYETSFIQEWVHRIMFFDLSEQTFTLIYAAFFALMLLTIWVVPPRWRRKG